MSENTPEQLELAELLTGALKVDERNATLPPIETIYERILHHWGGVDQFALELVEVCREAKAGSQIKARLMESILDGFKVLRDRGLLGTPTDAEALDDEELQLAIKQETQDAARIVLKATNGRVQQERLDTD